MLISKSSSGLTKKRGQISHQWLVKIFCQPSSYSITNQPNWPTVDIGQKAIKVQNTSHQICHRTAKSEAYKDLNGGNIF